MDFLKRINQIQQRQQELEIESELLLQKGIQSENPTEIVKAMNYLNKKGSQKTSSKTSFFDPLLFNDTFGYKRKPTQMSYKMLYQMAKTPVVKAIITTRRNQVADFAKPASDMYSTGFRIQKKGWMKEDELSKKDQDIIAYITEFLLRTGKEESWKRDSFEHFLRKYVTDSLIYDQACFEIVRTFSGEIFEFFMAPSDTIRIADSYDTDEYERLGTTQREFKNGHFPSYLQVMNEATMAEYYPWELAFGIRNPTTRIWGGHYGCSELEDMVNIVTSLLWSDQYNRNFFKQGSAPKGLLRVKGGAGTTALHEFRQQWRSMVAGVHNAYKTPIIDSESLEWIDLQKTNRDMEFSQWNELNIKLCCALYTIDPSEIGFSSGQPQGAKPLFESSNASRIKYSKDKGLSPLLTHIAANLNKYIISPQWPDYEFVFTGIDAPTKEEHIELLIKKVSNFMTVNEARAELNMKPVEGGDIILNSVFQQAQQAQAMEQAQQEGAEEGGEDMDIKFEEGENPFTKALDIFVERLNDEGTNP